MAFGAAEAEGARVIAHKGDAFGGVDGAGAEVACFDSGGGNSLSVTLHSSVRICKCSPHDCRARARKYCVEAIINLCELLMESSRPMVPFFSSGRDFGRVSLDTAADKLLRKEI